jgi:hypothetical protein
MVSEAKRFARAKVSGGRMGGMTPIRPNSHCREHTRRWRDHCVDKNLEDSWLEALNNLGTFKLINICEGHYGSRRTSDRPHIILRLKERYIPLLLTEFDCAASQMQEELMKLWGEEATRVEARFEIKMNASRSRQEIQRDFCLRIESCPPRTEQVMDEATGTWFTSTIRRIQAWDAFFGKLIAGGSESCDNV